MLKQPLMQDLVQQQANLCLPELAQKIAQLRHLNQIWQKYIDIKLARHSRVANWRNGQLIIEVDDANWATHLRYALPELLLKLKAEPGLNELRFIRWYIRPQETVASRVKAHQPALLSKENSQLIQQSAEHIQNTALKRSLLALAKRTAN